MRNDDGLDRLLASLGQQLTLYIGLPVLIAFWSGIGFALAYAVNLPIALCCGAKPEQFMNDHFDLFLVLWAFGTVLAFVSSMTRSSRPEWGKRIDKFIVNVLYILLFVAIVGVLGLVFTLWMIR